MTKYYFAGAQRVAMRKYTDPTSMAVEYLLGDHLGSTSLTADSSGTKVSEIRYKPWGEIRYSWTSGVATTPGYKLSSYTFTGQYSYMDDPTTTGVTEGFGLMFYNARFYSPYQNQERFEKIAKRSLFIPLNQGLHSVQTMLQLVVVRLYLYPFYQNKQPLKLGCHISKYSIRHRVR